jgi:hypothetical protein
MRIMFGRRVNVGFGWRIMGKSTVSVGFFGLLFLLFLGLKLGKVIDWSWWFIFMPLYLPMVLGILTILFMWIFLGKKLKKMI